MTITSEQLALLGPAGRAAINQQSGASAKERAITCAALLAERARITAILAHPRANERFALAVQCVSEGAHAAIAQVALDTD
jgi:hypothetical protein